MSLRLRALALYLRLVEKPYLARATDPVEGRARLGATARRIFPDPPGASYARAEIGGVGGLWARCGPAIPGAAILYLHGGAFIMGSANTHRHLGAALARESGVAAFLPDYRLAPEHPHPAALEDALAAYLGLLDAGFARIAVAGDSAGGGLGFAMVGAARKAGAPDPACLVGFSPWTDMTMRAPALRRNAWADPMLPVARMPEVIAWRMGGGDPLDPSASPALARFDPAPPPALIQASPSEILADDARAMAEVLRACGGSATLEWERGAPHAFQAFCGSVPEARAAVARAGAFIRAGLRARPDEETGDAA